MIVVRSKLLRIGVIVLSAFLLVRLFTVLHDYRKLNKDYQNELKTKEQYEDKNAELRSICDQKSKEKMIENAARERFGYAYPNEEFYIAH